MPFKLALRNVRRRALTYIVYLVTVVLTAALMLASNGVLFADELLEYVHFIYGAVIVMTRFVTAVVAVAVCFIICHATTWMLGRRRREFGTYMLLGVPRRKVVALFAAENRRRYAILYALGLNRKQQRRMLRNEILKFFALPLMLPLISVIPTLCTCAIVCDFVASLHVGVFVAGIGVPLIYVAILACYFGVTYFISAKTVLGAKAA